MNAKLGRRQGKGEDAKGGSQSLINNSMPAFWLALDVIHLFTEIVFTFISLFFFLFYSFFPPILRGSHRRDDLHLILDLRLLAQGRRQHRRRKLRSPNLKRSRQILKEEKELKEKLLATFLFWRRNLKKRSHVLKNNCLPCWVRLLKGIRVRRRCWPGRPTTGQTSVTFSWTSCWVWWCYWSQPEKNERGKHVSR